MTYHTFKHGVTRYSILKGRGKHYEGEAFNGLAHGYGMYKYDDKTYAGEFKNGFMDGKGRITYDKLPKAVTDVKHHIGIELERVHHFET